MRSCLFPLEAQDPWPGLCYSLGLLQEQPVFQERPPDSLVGYFFSYQDDVLSEVALQVNFPFFQAFHYCFIYQENQNDKQAFLSFD